MTAPVGMQFGGRTFSPALSFASPESWARSVIFAISGVSWLTLVVWSQSELADHLNHGDWTNAGLLQSICVTPRAGGTTISFFLAVLSWLLMVLAMMLPLSASIFSRLFSSSEGSSAMIVKFSLGYLLIALCAGVGYHTFGYVFNRIAGQIDLLVFNGWIVGAAMLAFAGVFQFTRTKHRAGMLSHRILLDQGAFIGGLRHGGACFVCCLALMGLMFVFWAGSVVWMVMLALVMGIERWSYQKAPLRQPVGFALLIAAGVVSSANI